MASFLLSFLRFPEHAFQKRAMKEVLAVLASHSPIHAISGEVLGTHTCLPPSPDTFASLFLNDLSRMPDGGAFLLQSMQEGREGAGTDAIAMVLEFGDHRCTRDRLPPSIRKEVNLNKPRKHARTTDTILDYRIAIVSPRKTMVKMLDLAPFSESRNGEIPLERVWQR
jgi:hypothetical protein